MKEKKKQLYIKINHGNKTHINFNVPIEQTGARTTIGRIGFA